MTDYESGLEVRVNNQSSQIFNDLINYINLGFERSVNFYNLTIDKAKKFKSNLVYTFEALGKDGKIIRVSKFKTMYGSPSNDDFDEIDHFGKPRNGDARVIPSRKFLREHHLDELLNIISLFPHFIREYKSFLRSELNKASKGDLKFVGIRPKPISNWQRNYTKEERELLLEDEPALNGVPYAKPWQPGKVTELEYKKELKEEPQTTDLKYFFDIWYNKFFNGHRSH